MIKSLSSNFKNYDNFIIDTCVYRFVYYPDNTQIYSDKQYIKKCSEYGKFLSDLFDSKKTIFLSNIQISEFIHGVLRQEYFNYKADIDNKNKYNKKNGLPLEKCLKIKEFRNTNNFNSALSDILIIVKDIMDKSKIISDNFDRINFDEFIKNPSLNKIDYNDKYLLKLARDNSLIIVSDDKDFKCVSDITLYTYK